MKTWIDPPNYPIPDELAALGYHPLILAKLVRLGITDPEAAKRFMDTSAYTPASPFDLPDMTKAVERLESAITGKEHILVWGDFDVDGQTATSLLVGALRGLGAEVSYYIPHRLKEGHGVDVDRLRTLIDGGAQVLLTCDTGIAAHNAVDYAQGRGVDVIITDHHQLPETLPDAYAAINPQRLEKGHPLRTLPGVGAAYKLIEAMYDRAGRLDTVDSYLDLVALGIVADVAEQTGDTRYLLQLGLERLRNTERLGLIELMKLAKIDPIHLNEENIGFGIAPRMNALGRLADANDAVELLTTDNLERARILANTLEGLNAERRMLSDQVFKAAEDQIAADSNLLNYAVLILGQEHWPGGVVGIVANRLVERYSRPVILLHTDADGVSRGSARSVAGCNITAAIAEHDDLLLGYGGHTMAAGLSLPTENIGALRGRLSQTVKEMLIDVDTTPTLRIDAYLPLADVTEDLLAQIEKVAPFGPGNPPLKLAACKLTLADTRQIGRTGDHQRLTVQDEAGTMREIVWWRAELDQLPRGRFDLAFTLSANYYNGEREMQLTFVDVRTVDEAPQAFTHRTDVAIEDYRDLPIDEQTVKLSEFISDSVIWSEGTNEVDVVSVTRSRLKEAPTLAIWTAPAGPEALRMVLEAVNPERVVLFGVNPGTDSMNTFLERLVGAVKHTLNAKAGITTFTDLCGAMGHRKATVEAGLVWMVARGKITIDGIDGDTLHLSQDGVDDRSRYADTTAALGPLLQETAAYRAYFRKATPESLILSHL